MNMNDILARLNELTQEAGDQVQITPNQAVVAAVIVVIIGLALCFFGLKLVRILAAIASFLIGLAIGVAIAERLGVDGLVYALVMVGCAAVVAIIGAIFYKVGIFFWVLVAGIFTAAYIFRPETATMIIVCIVIGLVLAILTAIFMEPLLIVLTAMQGAGAIGNAAAVFLGLGGNFWIRLAIFAVFAILGMIVQFMARSRQLGNVERLHATAYREKASREAEVEKARKVLLDDDESSDTDEDEDDDIKFVD